MNHCLQCHQDFTQGDRHIFKCKTKTDDCSKCLSPEKQALLKEIHKGEVIEVNGAFGDFTPNIGYINKEKSKDGETYFWGCTIPYRYDLDPRRHDSATAVKRTLISSLRLVLKLLKNPFRPIKYGVEWFYDNVSADFEKKIERITFSPMCDELYMKGKVMIERRHPPDNSLVVRKKGLTTLDRSHLYPHKVLTSFKAFVAFFQTSNSYHAILQDALSAIDMVKLRENTRKELMRVFDLVISRVESAERYKDSLTEPYEHTKEFSDRMKMVRKGISFVLRVSSVKRTAKEYLLSLDRSVINPDIYDLYYAYRRHNYDFRGISYEERIKQIRRFDKANNHIIFESKAEWKDIHGI